MTSPVGRRAALAGGAALALPLRRAQAAGSVKIGVLTEMGGTYAADSGSGSVIAARMAVEDFAREQPGAIAVEVISGDAQTKPDIASALARAWFDQGGVDAVFDVPVSNCALAVATVARAFSGRWAPLNSGNKPSMIHAGCYAGVLHYLRAIASGAPRADGVATVAQMKRMPTTDTLFGPGRIREDGRKIHDMHLFRVKAPAAAHSDWDMYDLVQTTPGEQAFRPLAQGGCPLLPA